MPAIAGYTTSGTPGLHGYYPVVKGGADGAEPGVAFIMKVPDDFVSFTSVQAVWACDAAAGNMYWLLNANYASSGEPYHTHSENPAVGITATGGLHIINVQTPANPLTLANLVAADYLGLYFYRSGANPNDTLNQEVRLYGLLFTYVASQ